ncbi:MAG: hypothetical protein MJE77_17925 [Proteobacteria bacterium]|nr:hypothetical protein [Pseudomonadota bacterium]
MKGKISLAVLLVSFLYSSTASAGVWFEFLYAPCLTGDDDDLDRGPDGEDPFGLYGSYNGAIDCYNNDFNGDGERFIWTIKAFQAWEYGTMFMYYDITGPFKNPSLGAVPNEKGGFFGGITVTLSIKQIVDKLTGKESSWGPLANLHVKYEAEHVSNFGMLHYVGLQYDFAVPFLDFLTAQSVVREDRSLSGVDLQLGAAWQKSFSLGPVDFIFGGFFSWGLFGEGEGKGDFSGEGRPFFLTQPQLLWDLGKTIKLAPAKLYAGFEYQFTINRYLIKEKSENVLSGMIRWNI